MAKIINFGTANIDEIMQIDILPKIGETRFTEKLAIQLGGKGANQAVSVAKAGGIAVFIGSIGADSMGETIIEKLRAFNVDTSCMVKNSVLPTGVAHVWAEETSKHNVILCAYGANRGSEEKQIKKLKEVLEPGDVIMTTLEYKKDFIYAVAEISEEAGCRLFIDPSGSIELASDPEIAKRTYLIKPNEVEAGQITGIEIRSREEALEALRRLKSLGYKEPLVSLGENGCVAYIGDKERYFEPYKVCSIDSTGAGDSFIGYIAAGVAGGMDLEASILRASKAAAICTTKIGAAGSVPVYTELDM